MEQKDLNSMARQLRELYPQDPAGLLQSLRWLCRHPDTAEFLCGRESGQTAEDVVQELQGAGQREYLALLGWALMKKEKIASEKTGDNPVKTEENKRTKNIP